MRLKALANTSQHDYTEVLSLKDLESFITQVAAGLGKSGMRERVKVRVDFRGQMPPRGREAGGAMAPTLTVTYDLLDRFRLGES